MSINLCSDNIDGLTAANLLEGKLIDPALAIEVGERVMLYILGVEHIGDGLAMVSFVDHQDRPGVFQFAPSLEPFAKTAVDGDGRPICPQAD